MAADSELVELQEIYRNMDNKSRKKLTLSAEQLLCAQKILKTKPKEDQSQELPVKTRDQ